MSMMGGVWCRGASLQGKVLVHECFCAIYISDQGGNILIKCYRNTLWNANSVGQEWRNYYETNVWNF